MRRLLQFLISASSTAILIAVALGYLGHFLFELDLLAHFRLHFLFLCVPVALIAGLLRRWGALWRSLVAAVLALAGLSVLWEVPLRPGEGVEVTVMAANLYQRNAEPDEMKRALLEVDADVLVTMETTKAILSGPNSLALKYPYRLSLGTSGQILRTVIWSKYPMRDGRLMLEDRVEPTGATAVIEFSPDVEFSVLGLHFAHNIVGNQLQQIEALDRISEGLPKPLIVIGDFNATAWSYAMRRVAQLTATKRIGGFHVTWKGNYPTPFGNISAPFGLQIDHALISNEIGVREMLTVDIPGSDHKAVVAHLVMPILSAADRSNR